MKSKNYDALKPSSKMIVLSFKTTTTHTLNVVLHNDQPITNDKIL